MSFGQRALFLWLLVLFSLVFLALHLDFGIDPFIGFLFLWLTDLSILFFASLRCARVTRFGEGVKIVLTSVVPIVSKFVFEVLFFVRLKYNGSQDLLLTMLPSWFCFAFVIFILSSRIYKSVKSC
ncbi:hypothetical protein niasHS_003860 [Heterodera schachtii]|uniref:Uncharacterized protein n=1 Tax=Heterodera schachtii TaxID=97005 RepID=A0ABD2K3G2_HETSC